MKYSVPTMHPMHRDTHYLTTNTNLHLLSTNEKLDFLWEIYTQVDNLPTTATHSETIQVEARPGLAFSVTAHTASGATSTFLAMAASSHGRCGAGSAARPVFSSAHLARLFWDSFFAGSSRVALVVSNPPGERPPISVLFALRTGVACRGQLLRQPPRREYARCSGLPYGVQRWIAPNVGVEVLCEAEGLRFTKVPGNPADAVGGRQTGYILTAIPEEAINSKWAVFVDRSTNCRTLIIKRIGDWVQVPLQDSTAEEIVGIDTALVPLPENAYCRVVFNKMVDDEALLILSGETIEITLLDVELTHKSKIVVAVGAPVTVCNLDPMFADGDSLVTRKKNGDVVFILSEWKDFCLEYVGLVAVDAKTGNVVHLTGRCSSLTQVSTSVFCVWCSPDHSYQLWDCNNLEQPLSTHCDDGFDQVVGGRGFLFTVSRGKILVIDSLSGGVVVTFDAPCQWKSLTIAPYCFL
ncbi:hypothetical protein Pelo_16967 [Pelomyxa schiedti]|nr:hypothetical protein Pelo_16967 [Pelomyxa schiedti]